MIPIQSACGQTCTATPSNMAFGSFSPISRIDANASGNVLVNCTWTPLNLQNALVCLNLSAPSPRSMTATSGGTVNNLVYDLYVDAARSQSWSTGTNAIAVTLLRPVTGLTANTNISYYGRIVGNQPTVPSIGNASTDYNQSLTPFASYVVAPYLLVAPTCASVTGSTGALNFSASATVVNNCNITASNIGFAPAALLTTANNATGTIGIACTNGDAWRITLSPGGSGNQLARLLRPAAGGGTVAYQLYVDSARSTIWGDTTAGTGAATGTGTGGSQSVTVFAQVPVQPTPPPGTYSDTITATISF